MNKQFLAQLTERRSIFKLLDLSVDDEKANDEEAEEDVDSDESDEASDEELIQKTKYNARQFTKYLQYITASD